MLGHSIQMGGGHEGDIAKAAHIINAAGKPFSPWFLGELCTAPVLSRLQGCHGGLPGAPRTHCPRALPVLSAAFPVMLCGMFASSPDAVEQLRKMLRVAVMPTVTTFQGAGVAGRELVSAELARAGWRRPSGVQISQCTASPTCQLSLALLPFLRLSCTQGAWASSPTPSATAC